MRSSKPNLGDTEAWIFTGPIRQSEQDMTLTLTATHAIVDIPQYKQVDKLVQDIHAKIARTYLGFSQKKKFLHKLAWTGGPEFGTYVDGFPYQIVICFQLSEAQQAALHQLLGAWGGEISLLGIEEAIERNNQTLSKQERKAHFFVALVTFVYFIVTVPLMFYGWLKRKLRWTQLWGLQRPIKQVKIHRTTMCLWARGPNCRVIVITIFRDIVSIAIAYPW